MAIPCGLVADNVGYLGNVIRRGKTATTADITDQQKQEMKVLKPPFRQMLTAQLRGFEAASPGKSRKYSTKGSLQTRWFSSPSINKVPSSTLSLPVPTNQYFPPSRS